MQRCNKISTFHFLLNRAQCNLIASKIYLCGMHGGTAGSIRASELQRPGFSPGFNLDLLLQSVQSFTDSPRV